MNGFAAIGIKGQAAGLVVVYDLSPGAAFGLVQRSVYTPDGRAALGAKYVNCPTLTLDRVNGAKVLADAKAGKRGTLTLTARFSRDTGKAIIAHLPGKNYGTLQDEQIWKIAMFLKRMDMLPPTVDAEWKKVPSVAATSPPK